MSNVISNKDFIKEVATVSNHTQKDVKEILDAMDEVIAKGISEESTIKAFKGISLAGVAKEAHEARNPLNGETVSVPRKVVPKAKFTASFKSLVSGIEK